MADGKPTMTLRLLTPAGLSEEIACDDVILTQRDSVTGRGGGFVGVRAGHAPAVIALGEGPVEASLGAKTVFRASISGGFASVKDDVVTVITDHADVDPDPASGAEEL